MSDSKLNGVLNEEAMAENEQFEPIRTVRPRYSYYDKKESGPLARGERSSIRIINPTSKNSSKPDSLNKFKSYDALNSEEGYGSFFLQRISVNYTEKSQILQTFGGADVVYYFGSAPVVFNLSGLLFDDAQNGWFTEFAITYNEMLRGTQLAKKQQLLEIDTPNLKIIGTISSFNHSQDSARDTDIPFNISIIAQRVFYKPFSVEGKSSLIGGELPAAFTPENETVTNLTTEEQNAARSRDSIELNGLGTVEPYTSSFNSSVISVTELLKSRTDTLTGFEEGLDGFTQNLTDFLSAAVNPIDQLLGAVQDITNAATSLVRATETSVQEIINVPMRTLTNLRNTEALIVDSWGVITHLPDSLSNRVSRFIKEGIYDGTEAILQGAQSSSETANILSQRPNRTGDLTGTLGNTEDASAILSANTNTTVDEGASI